MQGGFSFCGTDIAELNLEYVPDNANTYVYAGAQGKVHEQSFDAHDGGYFYGVTTGVKTFTLRCIFQESHINDGILTKVETFFRKGKTGRQVFKKRPWVFYVATVTDVQVGNITNYLNGFVVIQMKAYYPYGRCDDLFYPDDCEYSDNILANSNMLPASKAFSCEAIADGDVATTQFEVPLYNGGTLPAHVAIEIAGDVGDGVIITNTSTGQKCEFVGITKSLTTDKGRYIVCDAMNGRTVLTDGVTATDANLYHNYGFQNLNPNEILVRESDGWFVHVTANYVGRYGGHPDFDDSYVGKYIYTLGKWRKVKHRVSDAYLDVDYLPEEQYDIPGTTYAEIMTVAAPNNIVVTPISTMSLSKLNFVYKPTFA